MELGCGTYHIDGGRLRTGVGWGLVNGEVWDDGGCVW